jgi:DNA-3-methyladenine glycosylase I
MRRRPQPAFLHGGAENLVELQQSISVAEQYQRPPTRSAIGRGGSPQTASTSAASIALSKDLKKQGWKFVGPTTVYAFMQAMGLINDHVEDCVIRAKVERARKKFRRPGR